MLHPRRTAPPIKRELTLTPCVPLDPQSSQLVAGDVDGDGDVDVVVARNNAGQPGTNYMYRNHGNGTFAFDATTEITTSGLASTNSLTLGDLDGDGNEPSAAASAPGLPLARSLALTPLTLPCIPPPLPYAGDLDLLVANKLATDQLFWNSGDGTFRIDSSSALSAGAASTHHATMVKIEGALNVFILGDQVYLYEPRPITAFTEVTADYPELQWPPQSGSTFYDATNDAYYIGDYVMADMAGSCIRFADVDGDGDLDVAISTLYRIRILINAGDGTFMRELVELGDQPMTGRRHSDGTRVPIPVGTIIERPLMTRSITRGASCSCCQGERIYRATIPLRPLPHRFGLPLSQACPVLLLHRHAICGRRWRRRSGSGRRRWFHKGPVLERGGRNVHGGCEQRTRIHGLFDKLPKMSGVPRLPRLPLGLYHH